MFRPANLNIVFVNKRKFLWEIICKLLRKAIKHFHQMDHVCVGRDVIKKYFEPRCFLHIKHALILCTDGNVETFIRQ